MSPDGGSKQNMLEIQRCRMGVRLVPSCLRGSKFVYVGEHQCYDLHRANGGHGTYLAPKRHPECSQNLSTQRKTRRRDGSKQDLEWLWWSKNPGGPHELAI